MDKYIFHPMVFGCIAQAFKMLEVCMHSSVRYQAQKVYFFLSCFRSGKGSAQDRMGKQFPLLYCQIDFYQVLVDNPTRTNIHVPNF